MSYLRTFTQVVFPLVVWAARHITIQALDKKQMHVVSRGNDLSEIVTSCDLLVSEVLLEGTHDMPGLRTYLPGSFSEETDSPDRHTCRVLFQVDPCDGTGDLVKTTGTGTDNIIGPTTLVSYLERTAYGLFEPKACLIYDVHHEYGVVSDGKQILLGHTNSAGTWVRVATKHCSTEIPLESIRLNQRICYSQPNAHVVFPQFLEKQGISVKQVAVGGAGTQTLQLLRSMLEPFNHRLLPAFADLAPIDVIFNCQPDWKTWDTDPIRVISKASALPPPTDIYGNPLLQNASMASFSDMHHRQGCVFGRTKELLHTLTLAAQAFAREHGLAALLEKDY